MRPVRIAPIDTVATPLPGGGMHMVSPYPLGPYPEKLT
jgi:hypothetical protein